MASQSARLAARRHNEFWPSYLFHACDVTNAVKIVASGRLECRNNLVDFTDVAHQGAVNNFVGSHTHARLYLRPKNTFHLMTEGILCRSDPHRLANHMSVPVMFIFHFADVITKDEAYFSEGNIQKNGRSWLDGDAAFDALDFNAIYHDAAPPQGQGDYIRDMRMTEVGVVGGLDLGGNLAAILFRTKWDMETFKQLLQDVGVECPYTLGIEQIQASIFQSRGLFLSDVSVTDGSLLLKFSFPVANYPADGIYSVEVRQTTQDGKWSYKKQLKLARSGLLIKGFSKDPGRWQIKLEDQLAFDAELKSEISSIFS